MQAQNLNWSSGKSVAPALAPELAWIDENAKTNSFAASLNAYLLRHGKLTEKQMKAVRKQLAQNHEPLPSEMCQESSVKALQDAFDKARGNGIKNPKINLANFRFKPAPKNGRNPNAIYVMQGDDYLGKIDNAKFVATRDCSEEQKREIVDVCSTPHKAAVAYGQRTGNCAICNRELSNKDSINLGVGMICAEKYGFVGFASQFAVETPDPPEESIFEDLFSN